MQTIGERLEEARKKKGISIREAAEATKIRGDYLSRFENNQFDINLTELYVRGFLRTYAQFLRLPVDRILNDYATLGRGESRPRQPSREIYGRMDVSIVSADDRADGPAGSPEDSSAPAAPARRTPAPRRSVAAGAGSSLDPALVFKLVKWSAIAIGAILVVWGLSALFSSATGSSNSSTTAANAPAAINPSEPTITIVALDSVRVKVAVRNPDGSSGEVLLPDTTLARGERRVVPRRGTLYLTATALENVAIEENGHTTTIRDQGIKGYSRVQIGR
jgi:transcriptional regulator with XRE-family HTH domain